MLLAIALFLGYTLWSAGWEKGKTALGRSWDYYHTEAGVVIKWAPPENEFSERTQRVLDRAERSGTDFYDSMPEAGPSVDGYRVYRKAIIGHTARPRIKTSYGDPIRILNPHPVGYFIIDARTDIVYEGLSKREWLKKLRGYGIVREPRLYRPSAFDEILRRNRPTDP